MVTSGVIVARSNIVCDHFDYFVCLVVMRAELSVTLAMEMM